MTQKCAIVTGAARGIGLATTDLFLEQGWRVAMVDWDAKALREVVATRKDVLGIERDISNPQDVNAMVRETQDWAGRIDSLINNAGIAEFGPIADCDFEMWRRVMSTNLDGVFLCSQAVSDALKETRGSIVNIASISGLRASTLRVAYGTSKAAVAHLTKQFAAELGDFGIRVNCIAPGPVKTKLSMAVHSQAIINAYHDGIPLNRYGSERELAEGIVFLASERASYITGQVLAVDGGFDSTGVGLPALRGTAHGEG